MTYEDVKYLARRTAADKFLRDEAFSIAQNLKYDEYQRGLASTNYNLFIKKPKTVGINEIKQNEQLAEELHKPVIWKF